MQCAVLWFLIRDNGDVSVVFSVFCSVVVVKQPVYFVKWQRSLKLWRSWICVIIWFFLFLFVDVEILFPWFYSFATHLFCDRVVVFGIVEVLDLQKYSILTVHWYIASIYMFLHLAFVMYLWTCNVRVSYCV